jgi:DNA polymerase-3 subunit epsilon
MRANAREQALAEARRIHALKPVFLDTETTGLGETAEVVDIAIVDFDRRVLLNSLVRPRRPIPPDAARVHGVTDAMVKDAPTWPELIPTIEELLKGRPLAIYNAEFDLRVIGQSSRAWGQARQLAYSEAFCVMQLYARYNGEWNPKHRNYRWISLEQAGRRLRISLPNTHRALGDALLSRAVLHTLAESP